MVPTAQILHLFSSANLPLINFNRNNVSSVNKEKHEKCFKSNPINRHDSYTVCFYYR